MARKIDGYYDQMLNAQIQDAITNDFGRAIMKLPNQGMGEVRDEVFIYFSAVAMEQINVLSSKYGIDDVNALNELYQMCRSNLIQGFRIGQKMGSNWSPS